jgi:hypothetical protein
MTNPIRSVPQTSARWNSSTTILLVIVVLTALNYAPMFAGTIPFPTDSVSSWPPFSRVAPPNPPTPHADIGDLVHSFYPFRTLAARSIRHGELPLWNPYMLSGTPFLANAQSALFYPANFLYYFLPVPLAWGLGFPLRRFLAAIFTALFLRRIGATTTGAITSALLFSFCGFLTVWQGSAMSDAAIWLPLICYSVVRLHSDLSTRAVLLTAFAFTMPVLAGHPETAIHLTITGLGLAVLMAFRTQDATIGLNFRFIKLFVFAGLLALGLASVQVIPTLEWLNYIRHPLHESWPPLPLWTMVAWTSRDVVRAVNSIGLEIPEQAAYIGMLAFVAAPVALLHPSRKFAVFFVAVCVAALSIAYGTGPIFHFVQHVPVLRILKNNRLILVASFGLSVLAGLGISSIEVVATDLSRRTRIAMLSTVGVASAFALLYVGHLMTQQIVEFIRRPRLALLLLFSAVIVVSLKLLGNFEGPRFQAAIVALVAIDVLTFNYFVIPFAKPHEVFPRVELFARLQNDSVSPFRIAEIDYASGPNFQLMYGLPAVGGYEICLDRIKTFLADVSTDEMPNVTLTGKGVLNMKDRRLDLLNAKYIVVSEWDPLHVEFRNRPDRFLFLYNTDDTNVFENLKVLPPAFLVPTIGTESFASEAQELARVMDPSFNPQKSVVLADRPPQESNASTPAPVEKVDWISKATNGFTLKVDAVQPSVLVVSQMNYPGWKAYVDGKSTPVVRADYALSAIRVDQGSHNVHFSFEPLSFKIGLSLSVIAALICLIIIFHERPNPRWR